MSIIAVFNLKGGVGRTTTALNLLAAIARRGQRPLGIDLDPQGHLSRMFGARPLRADDSIHGFLAHRRPLLDIAQITKSGVALCPSHPELARLDASLGRGLEAIHRLRDALRDPQSTADSAAVIDTSPLLGPLSLNAIFACDVVLVPVSCEPLALQAARDVDRTLNAFEPVLKRRLPRRYLLTRFDTQRALSVSIAERMQSHLAADDICATRIREDDALAESAAAELDIFRHAPSSTGAQDFQALADELVTAGFVA